MRSALTHEERDLLRTYLAARPWRRTVATWQPIRVWDDNAWHVVGVRVTFTTWGRRDVVDQEGVNVTGLRDAWHAVVAWLGIPHQYAADRRTFLAWAALGRR